jgi:feruloyl esterase
MLTAPEKRLQNIHPYSKALLAAAAFIPFAKAGASCESLSSLSRPETKISFAQSIAEGAFTPPSGAQPIHNLPAFCRVAATLTPSKDS